MTVPTAATSDHLRNEAISLTSLPIEILNICFSFLLDRDELTCWSASVPMRGSISLVCQAFYQALVMSRRYYAVRIVVDAKLPDNTCDEPESSIIGSSDGSNTRNTTAERIESHDDQRSQQQQQHLRLLRQLNDLWFTHPHVNGLIVTEQTLVNPDSTLKFFPLLNDVNNNNNNNNSDGDSNHDHYDDEDNNNEEPSKQRRQRRFIRYLCISRNKSLTNHFIAQLCGTPPLRDSLEVLKLEYPRALPPLEKINLKYLRRLEIMCVWDGFKSKASTIIQDDEVSAIFGVSVTSDKRSLDSVSSETPTTATAGDAAAAEEKKEEAVTVHYGDPLCPVLEEFILMDCDTIRSPYIVSKTLRKINFRGCRNLRTPVVDCLKLEEFYLSHCVFLQDSLVSSLSRGAPLLRRLAVDFCNSLQAPVIRLPRLEVLQLGGQRLVAPRFEGDNNLWRLSLTSSPHISDDAISKLLPSCPNLTVLELSFCKLVSPVICTPRLRKLDLSFNFGLVSPVIESTRLEVLVVAYCPQYKKKPSEAATPTSTPTAPTPEVPTAAITMLSSPQN